MVLEKSSGIFIPISEQDQFWVNSFKHQLTRSSKDFGSDVYVTTEYFERKDGYIKIPRLCKINNPEIEFEDKCTNGEDINIKFTSQLRNDLQRQALKYFQTNDSGVLKLKPGEGKTVISIAAVCAIRKKAIILVHKDSLVTQWQERFLQHSDIKNEDIGILKTDKYKEILQKPVVIGTVQTMCSMIKRIPDLLEVMRKANFGIGIWDECHTTGGAPLFSLSCYYVPARKCFGLSATPGRSDHNDDIIHMHLGEVFEPVGQSNTLAPRVVMTYFDHGALKNHRYYIMFGPPIDGKKPFPKFDPNRYKQMLDSKKNHSFVTTVKQIISFLYNKNRNILIICDRIKLLDKLAEGFPPHDVGFFIPRSGKTRDDQLHRKIVFSTPGSSRDGTDNPNFDTLIMATPIGNLDQAIGRVCRCKEGKAQPLVFDMVDTGCQEMVDWALKRKKYYTEKVSTDNWVFEEKFLK